MIRIQQLKMPLHYSQEDLKKAAARELRITPDRIKEIRLRKKSIDARKKPDIYYVLTVDVKTQAERAILKSNRSGRVSLAKDVVYQYPQEGGRALKTRPVIVGSGPAGLFCGLLLARCGYRPLILERGEDVDTRTETVRRFWEDGVLDTSSNVQFGEGGAGTFSDGKLNTMVNDKLGRGAFVLQTFAATGAGEEILYMNKPHIGTDVLRTVVKNIRCEIEEAGGEVRFGSCVTDIDIRGGKVVSVTVNGAETIDCEVLVTAIGHSARDTFQMLADKAVPMEQKAFAIGVRIEHPQALINRAQYGRAADEILPAADYKLTAKLADGRGVYSFCMCPGGYVVNASSEAGMTAVNGMSFCARAGRNANSAIVVTVTPADFGGSGVLSGVAFQRKLEKNAYRLGGGAVPVQRFADFCLNKESARLGEITPCIKGAYRLSNVREIFPANLAASLEEGIRLFDGKIPGFGGGDVLLSGVESRTSSPVRILRGTEYVSAVEGLYPCGEGAGYAGGITSAAMDGMKVAEAVISTYRKI